MTGKEEQLQMDILHRMAYADKKKVTKSQIKEINISMIMDKHRTENLSLKQASILIIALAKVVARRFRFLMEDCTLAVQQISRSVSSTGRNVRIPSSKAITLTIENNLVLTDDGADMDSVYEEDIALNEGSMLEMGFGDLLSVEQVRNSAVQSSGIFGSDSMILKRRKIAEDKTTEIDESAFKGGLRGVADILKRQGSTVREQIKEMLRIDPWIAAVFRQTEKERTAVEVQRELSLGVEELDQSGFTISPDDNTTAASFGYPDTHDSQVVCLDLLALPATFKFGCAVEHQSIPNKASCFLSLLTLATEGRIAVQQIEPFSEIECAQINN